MAKISLNPSRSVAASAAANARPAGSCALPLEGLSTFVLAGGKGSRLGALTERRAKPAMPIAGSHRLIDFTLANCWNSGIPRVSVLTQHLAGSLEPHVRHSWGWTENTAAYASCLHATDGYDRAGGYRGTADAVYQHLVHTNAKTHPRVLVLAGDHVYRMDYGAMLEGHLHNGANVTVGCIRVPLDEAHAFGVMQTDRDERICEFTEKPERPKPMLGHDDVALASMGIYLFDTEYLMHLLDQDSGRADSSHDFGKDVIPAAIESGGAYVCGLRDPHNSLRQGYWRDVGTIDAYRRTNLEMAGESPQLDPNDSSWPLRPAGAAQPSSRRYGDRSIVAHDCDTRGAEISRCVLFPGVHVGARSILQGSVLLDGATVGPHCTIRNAIIEQDCRIPAGTAIGVDPDSDRQRFHLTAGGTVLVTPEMLLQGRPPAAASINPPPRVMQAEACHA